MNRPTGNHTVLRRDERVRDIVWPTIKKTYAPEIRHSDCLLVCAGFEERAGSTLRRICESQIVGRKQPPPGFSIGIIQYLPEQPQNRVDELRAISERLGLCVTDFSYYRENPSDMAEELREFGQMDNRIYVDISGMSRLLIVQTLVALIHGKNRPVSILYSEAMEYPPSEDEFERDKKETGVGAPASYLSSGTFEIAVLSELSSVSMFGEANRLVAFPSFDPTQLTNLVQEIQPTYTELIHGVPLDQKNKWRTEAIRYLNARTLDELYGTIDHKASTLDYMETLDILLNIYAQRSMFDRLVVAPTGSKMQAVAVGLFRAALPDVQIVYPTPRTFAEPDEYTVGFRQLYQLDLPINSIVDAVWGGGVDRAEPNWISK